MVGIGRVGRRRPRRTGRSGACSGGGGACRAVAGGSRRAGRAVRRRPRCPRPVGAVPPSRRRWSCSSTICNGSIWRAVAHCRSLPAACSSSGWRSFQHAGPARTRRPTPGLSSPSKVSPMRWPTAFSSMPVWTARTSVESSSPHAAGTRSSSSRRPGCSTLTSGQDSRSCPTRYRSGCRLSALSD